MRHGCHGAARLIREVTSSLTHWNGTTAVNSLSEFEYYNGFLFSLFAESSLATIPMSLKQRLDCHSLTYPGCVHSSPRPTTLSGLLGYNKNTGMASRQCGTGGGVREAMQDTGM